MAFSAAAATSFLISVTDFEISGRISERAEGDREKVEFSI